MSERFVSISISIPQRAQYEETILDLKKKVEEATGVPVDKQLLFWHFKELTQEYDNKTLLDLNLHTGFSLTGYDLVRTVRAYKRVYTSISFFVLSSLILDLFLDCCGHGAAGGNYNILTNDFLLSLTTVFLRLVADRGASLLAASDQDSRRIDDGY